MAENPTLEPDTPTESQEIDSLVQTLMRIEDLANPDPKIIETFQPTTTTLDASMYEPYSHNTNV